IGQSLGLGLTVVEAMGLTGFAFAGVLLAAAAVYLIAAAGRGVIQIQTLLLAGVIVGIFSASAITVIISLLDFNRLGGVIHWLLGNVAPIPPGALGLFAILLAVGFGLVLRHARELNLLALGEESAQQLGLNADRLKLTIFTGAALLTASVVAFAGPIGFVGLVVPHMLRMLLGPDNRLLVPTSIAGVIGPNSSGKTTLIRLLTRVLEPVEGEIALEGKRLQNWGRAELARRVAVVPQGVPREFPFTVEELVLMGRYPHAPGRYFEN